MNVLVVVAHPDDEILGVGGTICKHVANGDEVYICMVTKAYEPQWSEKYIKQKVEEQKDVDKYLGIKKRYNLDLPTVELNTIPHGELNNKITDVIDEVQPNVVYTHFEHDLNYDHILIFKACLVGTRPPKNISLYCFETQSETEWNTQAFHPNLWVDISSFINRKIEVFQIYKSEVKKYPNARSPDSLKALARLRGSDICREYAESFMVIRSYRL